MDLRIVGLRIKEAREAKNLTQEDLAALVDLSPTHISVIERGLKAVKLDKFVAIANALDVSADRLLFDVVTRSVDGVANELSQAIKKFPPDEQKRIIKAVRAYVEDLRRVYSITLLFLSFDVESGRTKKISLFIEICYISSKERVLKQTKERYFYEHR